MEKERALSYKSIGRSRHLSISTGQGLGNIDAKQEHYKIMWYLLFKVTILHFLLLKNSLMQAYIIEE